MKIEKAKESLSKSLLFFRSFLQTTLPKLPQKKYAPIWGYDPFVTSLDTKIQCTFLSIMKGSSSLLQQWKISSAPMTSGGPASVYAEAKGHPCYQSSARKWQRSRHDRNLGLNSKRSQTLINYVRWENGMEWPVILLTDL